MRYSQSIIAKQYAKAYMAEFSSQLQLKDIDNVKLVILFFRRHHNFMSLVSLLVQPNQSNSIVVDELFQHFSLPQNLKKLINVLVLHKRLTSFSQVLQDICCLYFQANNMLELAIVTAVSLQDDEREKFEIFFRKLSGKTIQSNMIIEQSLIAGVRLQSDLYLWEYSIAARLRNLHQNMRIEG